MALSAHACSVSSQTPGALPASPATIPAGSGGKGRSISKIEGVTTGNPGEIGWHILPTAPSPTRTPPRATAAPEGPAS